MEPYRLGIQFKAMYPECKMRLFSCQSKIGNFAEECQGEWTGRQFDLFTKHAHSNNIVKPFRTLADSSVCSQLIEGKYVSLWSI
jgi:hypothetical protein